MVLALLKKLITSISNTASQHKKKLIAAAILVIGFEIARRKIKTQTIISIVMFFLKFWTKIMEYIPIPTDPNFRHIQPFQCVKQIQIPELGNLINIKQQLMKIKNKQYGLDQFKIGVISTALLNIILYKVPIIYQLATQKYKADFSELGAIAQFQQTMRSLKVDFIKNLNNFRLFIQTQIRDIVDKYTLSDLFGVNQVKNLYKSFIDKLFESQIDISKKTLIRKTNLQQQKQSKLADNYFHTTKQYIQPKKSRISKITSVIFSPLTFIYTASSYLFKQPQQTLTIHRFSLNQYLYILPLKKFNASVQWPTLASKYLFQRVLQELFCFFYSINFNVVSHRAAQFNMQLFLNRINIYFIKRAKTQKKKLLDLLPIFYKIAQEEIVAIQRRKQFYQRELMSAFCDIRFNQNQNQKLPIAEYRLRNKILQQIYFKNQLQHLQKDMQAKYFNQRDGLTIQPVVQNSRVYEQKDEIQQLMNIYNKADQQKDTTKQQMKMMRELVD